MKVLVLGADGMVGHVVYLYFIEHGHDVVGINEHDIMLSDFFSLTKEIQIEKYDAVINCLAVINQDAEDDKTNAVRINSLLPHHLESVTIRTKTVVVHRSTDCIFSGNRGQYGIGDWPDAISFYARSKALGEINNQKDITIRTSLIGPEKDENGGGLFNWFYNQDGELNGFSNAIWTGITTIEFAHDVEWLLNNKKHGLFQMVPNSAISKYELLILFEKYYPRHRIIKRIENRRVDKSLIPVCGGLLIPDYETQIAQMRKWTDAHSDLYRYH